MPHSADDAPTVYVIAGPNGAGKTTFATEFLPRVMDVPEFLNADLIAAGLSPLAPETQNWRAGRLLLERFDELALARDDFGFETTLSGRSYLKRFKWLRERGYRILAHYLWLKDVELAVARVANRVQRGGHNVPEADIRRRYPTSLRHFFGEYSELFDAWWLYDSSHGLSRLIASGSDDKIQVQEPELYQRVRRSIGE